MLSPSPSCRASRWTSRKRGHKGSHRHKDSRESKCKSGCRRKRRQGKSHGANADTKAATSESPEAPLQRVRSRSRKIQKQREKVSSSKWDDPGADKVVAPAVAPTGAPVPNRAQGIAWPSSSGCDTTQHPVVAPTLKVASPFYRFLTIPVSHVGHLIGPRGACITNIRQASGADIKIDQPGGKLYATVAISGKGVDAAERLIYEKLASAPGNPR
mmetsp:Transcript_81501/g.189289  ORF Transcript_81501/g.189289 Transcript_81501/m.189289 type:complete len:214 (+) Transcript_81501:506-1147(+)